MPSNERTQQASAAPPGEEGPPLKPVATLIYSTGAYRVKAKLNLDEDVGDGGATVRLGGVAASTAAGEPLQDADLDELRRALASLPHLIGSDLAPRSAPAPLAPVTIDPGAGPADAERARPRSRARQYAIALADIVLLALCISLSARLGYWDFLRRPDAPWLQQIAAAPGQVVERLQPVLAELTSSASTLAHRLGSTPAPAAGGPAPIPPLDAHAPDAPSPAAPAASDDAAVSPPPSEAARAAVAALLPPPQAAPAPVAPPSAAPPSAGPPSAATPDDAVPDAAAAAAATPAADPSAPPAPSPPAAVAGAPVRAAGAFPVAAPVAAAIPDATLPASDAAAEGVAVALPDRDPAPTATVTASASDSTPVAPASAPVVEGDTAPPSPGEAPLFFVQFGAYRSAASAASNCAAFSALTAVGVVKGERGSKWFFCRTAAPLSRADGTALVERAKSLLHSDAFFVPAPSG